MSAAELPKEVAQTIREFLKLEGSGGIVLLAGALAGMAFANSPLAALYDSLLQTPVAVRVGALEIAKPLLLWINDGLMAVFFFLIGLEVKREFKEGELASPSQIVLPAVAALGGMAVPAAIYVAINRGDAAAMEGWAIPVATDIAFALAVLTVFASRVPTALKVFLLTLAIFDDLAAIVIIAVFYSGDLSLQALFVGLSLLAVAVAMNLAGVTRTSPYLLLGIAVWVAVLKSGVHATLAGVVVALCVPMRKADGSSPLRSLEDDLHTPVAYGILPLFAFANAGLALGTMSVGQLLDPVTVGIVLGLVVGKPVGILVFVGLAVLLRLAKLPTGVGWGGLLGAGCACGIGFTMSLFISGLAFERGGGAVGSGDRLAILLASTVSALLALLVLHLVLPKRGEAD